MKITLVVLLLFLGITAVAGGIGLTTNSMGMPKEWLSKSPFPDFTIPGLILLLIVGGSSLLAAFLQIKKHKYAIEASVTAGFGILIWIFTELMLIPHTSFLQVIYFSLGILILILSMLQLKRNAHK